jgi:hypothetical protein
MHHGYIEDCVRLVGDRHAAHLDVATAPATAADDVFVFGAIDQR